MPSPRLPEPRTLVWAVSLATSALLALGWSLIPTLESLPLLRVSLFAAMGLSMLGLVFSFPDLPHPKSRLLIVGAAILLRLVLLPAPASDDVHRYIWEGRLVATGENPYAAPADDEMWMSLRDHHWERMNHRDRPTAYPPSVLWLMSKVATTANPVLAFKLLALAADLTTLALLLLLLRIEVLPARWAGFYAFNPLVLISFAAEAHFDSLMIVAFVGSLLAALGKRRLPALLLLALAVHLKFIALLLLPFVLIRSKARRRKSKNRWWILSGEAVVFLIALVLATAPFAKAVVPWLKGLTQFANTSAFNGPLFSFLSLTGMAPESVRPICYGIFAIGFAALLIARFRGLGLIDCFLVALTLLLLCSPIVHFWYLAWLIPLTVLRPSFGWTTASITMAGYFLSWRTQAVHGWWGYGHLTAAAIWTPVVIAFIAQHRQLLPRILFHLKPRPEDSAPDRLGIVIPSLEAGPELYQLVEMITEETEVPVVIADASKHPPDLRGARVIRAPKGRGNQIAAGIDEVEADWILIAHADTLPRPGWHAALSEAILRHPHAAMLVLGQRFDATRPLTILVEILNEMRIVFGGVAFGDQSMVIRRSALESCGGFPAQPLMEDVETSLRLQTRGRLVYLGREWTVSANKWKSAGRLRFQTVVRFVATYQLARLKGSDHAADCARRLYDEYYPTVGTTVRSPKESD